MPRAIDLTGRRFGRLVALSFAGRVSQARAWACVCDCGNSCTVRAGNLLSGTTRSCGCLHRQTAADNGVRALTGKVKDLDGRRFGRLVVMSFAHRAKGETFYLCKCDCGNEKIVIAQALKNGGTKSCGCLHAETSAANMKTTASNPEIRAKIGASNRGKKKKKTRRLRCEGCSRWLLTSVWNKKFCKRCQKKKFRGEYSRDAKQKSRARKAFVDLSRTLTELDKLQPREQSDERPDHEEP